MDLNERAAAALQAMQEMVLQSQAQTQQLTALVQQQSQQIVQQQQQAQTPARVKPKDPSTFHGTGKPSPDSWVFEMETYFLAAGVTSEAMKVNMAATCLKDHASTWWRSIVQDASIPTPATWDAFKAAFLARFRPFESSMLARTALLAGNVRQLSSVQAYNAAFLDKINLIRDMAEADQVVIYQRGLKPLIGYDVGLANPKTLSAAMERAQLAESRGTFLRMLQMWEGGRGRSSAPAYRAQQWGQAGGYQQPVPMELGHLQSGASAERGADEWEYEEMQERKYDDAQESLHAMSGERRGGAGRGRGGRRGGGARQGGGAAHDLEHERRRRENRCFECGASDHYGRDCKVRKARLRSREKGRPSRAQRSTLLLLGRSTAVRPTSSRPSSTDSAHVASSPVRQRRRRQQLFTHPLISPSEQAEVQIPLQCWSILELLPLHRSSVCGAPSIPTESLDQVQHITLGDSHTRTASERARVLVRLDAHADRLSFVVVPLSVGVMPC